MVDSAISPASFETTRVTLAPPVVRGQSPDAQQWPPSSATSSSSYAPPINYTTLLGPRAQVPGPTGEPYNAGVVVENPPPLPPPPPNNGGLFDGCMGALTPTGNRAWFQSDHCFDNFISPLSNPFRFEDPRSLTEVRPNRT